MKKKVIKKGENLHCKIIHTTTKKIGLMTKKNKNKKRNGQIFIVDYKAHK